MNAFTLYKTPVPAKFYNDYKKAKERLEKAQNNNSNPVKLEKAKKKYEKLEKQLVTYTKNFKERPRRHKAEVDGLLTKNGNVITLKASNALIAGALVGGIATIAFIIATAGVGLALVVPVAGTALAAYVAVDPIVNKEFKKQRRIIKQNIQKEDIEFEANRQSNSPQQQQNSKTNMLGGMNNAMNKEKNTPPRRVRDQQTESKKAKSSRQKIS